MKTEQWAQDAIASLLRERLNHPVETEWQEARIAFLTQLSHELRTPVTSLKLALEGLCGELRDGMTQPQSRQAEICLRNVERIVALVENSLNDLDAGLDDGAETCAPIRFLPAD